MFKPVIGRIRWAATPLKILLRWSLAPLVHYRRRLAVQHHRLAVCAIFKDEAKHLAEWLRFHRGVGVEHFYLYNNNSSDDFRRVLADFACVTLIEWPGTKRQQRSAYVDCLNRFGGECRWIAFIDIDEFLFSPEQVDIRPLLSRYHGAPAIHILSPTFGAAGHETVPDSIIYAFTRRGDHCSNKLIADPRKIRTIITPHRFGYFGLADAVKVPMELLRLNHYWARSKVGMEEKVNRGDVWGVGPGRTLEWLRSMELCLNAFEDRTILPIAAAIETAAGRHRAEDQHQEALSVPQNPGISRG